MSWSAHFLFLTLLAIILMLNIFLLPVSLKRSHQLSTVPHHEEVSIHQYRSLSNTNDCSGKLCSPLSFIVQPFFPFPRTASAADSRSAQNSCAYYGVVDLLFWAFRVSFLVVQQISFQHRIDAFKAVAFHP